MSFVKVKVPKAGYLSVKWSPKRAPFRPTEEILSNPLHPLYTRTLQEFLKLPEDRLTWKVSTNRAKKQMHEEVLRRRMKRRWTAAFEEALRSRGLDQHGKVLDPKKDDIGKQVKPLTGTVDISVFTGHSLDAPYKYLVSQASDTLRAIAQKVEEGNKLAGQTHSNDGKREHFRRIGSKEST